MIRRPQSTVALWLASFCIAGWWINLDGERVRADVPSPFERLHALDRLAEYHHREARRLRSILEETSSLLEISSDEDNSQLDRTVRTRLRTQLAATRVRWDRTHRRVQRHRWQWAPGRSSDLTHLLRIVEREHLSSQRNRIDALRRLAKGDNQHAFWAGHRAQQTVELAQHDATKEAARQQAEGAIERARHDEEATRRAIERAEAALEKTLERMPDTRSRDFHRRKGALVRPVSREPTQTFGPNKQDEYLSYVRHTGLTYRVPSGTEVRAVSGGEVVYASRFEGYGELVMLAHGRRYHTLYAHLQSIAVEPGEAVDPRDVIGRSGRTGSLDGAKLYFELRRDGTPIDPAPWFVRGGD